MAYWIGYTRLGGYKAALYVANTDCASMQVNNTVRRGWFAVARVRWYVRRRVKLVPGIPVGLRDVGDAF